MKTLLACIALLGALLVGNGAVATAQDAPPDSFELAPGVTVDNMVFVEGQENPSLYDLHFAPGVTYPVQASPSLELVYMESGTMTLRLNAPVTVTQMGAKSGETVAADAEFTLIEGQYFVLSPGVSEKVRNDTEETATASIAGMIPGGTATPAAATSAA
ncbi:MAG: hypothetical protein M3457_07775 [Chloroflexota bacterium]|nr:hypothetical protein [Chloroflexota bacterium]